MRLNYTILGEPLNLSVCTILVDWEWIPLLIAELLKSMIGDMIYLAGETKYSLMKVESQNRHSINTAGNHTSSKKQLLNK